MHIAFRVVLLGVTAAASAWARPLTIEPTSTFSTPDAAYTGFAQSVAIDGDFALATAGRTEFDPETGVDADYLTAFLYRRSGTRWTVVRRLPEYRQDFYFPIPPAVAMRDGLAAVQTVRTEFWELTADGWVRAPSSVTRDGPGRHLAIDDGSVISGDGTGSYNGLVFEKDAAGTWRTASVLPGKPRFDGADDEFRGGAADISGNWAVVHQPDGDDTRIPETFIFHDYDDGTGWYPFPYGSANPPEGATRFGPEVAIRWPDVFVAGGNESGTYVFRETIAEGFALATQIQAVDSFMGSGPASAFAHANDLLLQRAWSHDRQAHVVNVFRRRADESYEHVAVLAARRGESLGNSVAISGRRVLVGGNDDGVVHYFIVPATFNGPARIQDTFDSGNGAGWMQEAGSGFGTAPRGNTRVFRQTNRTGVARAVLAASDFTSQAVEVDARPISFTAGDSAIGVHTRYQNPQNHFAALLRANGRVELRRTANGSARVLASAAFRASPARYYRLRLESIGTLHRVVIDGRVLIEVDSGGPTHGRAALMTDRALAEFDNVVVSSTLLATIYASDFEDGVGPWRMSGPGAWQLWPDQSTIWFQSSIAGDAHASIGVPTDDQIVRIRARLNTFATPNGTQQRWFGVMARHVDARNYYYLALRSSNTLSLRKVIDGRTTTLATVPFTVTPFTWHELRLDVIGDRLRGYVDGVLRVEARDGAHREGNAGPLTFKAAVDFDDFVAVQP